jgi:hypothetical protein
MHVFDRIEVDIVHVTREIVIVSNRVLPKAALPQRIFASAIRPKRGVKRGQSPRESALDGAPPPGKIRVSFGQCKNGVQMIRKHNNCVDGEGISPPSQSERHSQFSDMINQGA